MRLIDADTLIKEIKSDIMGGLNYEWYINEAPTIELCEDAISRERLKKDLSEWCTNLGNPKTLVNDDVMAVIDNIPTVIPIRPKEWTPCSERLPEETGRYLCTVGAPYRNPREMYYAPQEWADKSDEATWRSIDGYVSDWFVVAWMPLPEPWKGADDEKR